MKMIQAFSVVYNLFASQRLQNKITNLGTDDLSKIDSLATKLNNVSDKFYSQMDDNFKKQQLPVTLYFISKYIHAINQGNFKEAFDLSQQGYSSSSVDGIKQAFMINSIDSINMMKERLATEADKQYYQKVYGILEKYYANLLEDFANHQAIERLIKINVAESGLDVHYDGSYMSLAYLNHLNGNNEKAQECMCKLIEFNGVAKVEQMEIEHKLGNGFFYRHCTDEYRQFVKKACEEYTQKQDNKQKMSS